MSFVLKSIYKKIIDQAFSEGLPIDSISHLRFREMLLDDATYVSTDTFYEIYEIIEQHLEPAFSIRVASKMKLDDYGVLGLTWKTCYSPRDMFIRCERFFVLMTDTLLFKIQAEGDTGSIYLLRKATRRGVEISNESSLVATLTVLNEITAADIRPLQVTFTHKKPVDISPYEEFFGCPVHFGQEHNRLIFKSEDLDIRSIKADESINRFMFERLKEKADGEEIFIDKLIKDTSELIKDALPSGIPFAADIGKHLGMSTRTLSRRLTEKGTSFRQLVHDTQKAISLDLLRNTSETVGEIAYQAGFSEQSAFNRAFKRWTGTSPLEYRNIQ